jgi:phage gp36-like protein
MAYATLSDLLVRYRPISTMIGSGGYDVTSEEVNSVYIAQTEAYIDAYLGQRFAVPFAAPVNPLITQIASDLSIFFLLAEKMPSVPDFMDQRRQRADALLAQLAAGTLIIASASLVGSAGDNFAWSPTMGRIPVFSPVLADLDQRVDRDRVISEQVNRGIYSFGEECP